MTADDSAEQAQDAAATTCAALIMELAPLVMRTMRKELILHEGIDLSVPQFRALRYVSRRPSGSLSELAEHLGTTRPAASKLVDRLMELGLLNRTTDPQDRRQAVLTLTERGQQALQAAHAAAQSRLAQHIARLTAPELDQCAQALTTLRTLFGSGNL